LSAERTSLQHALDIDLETLEASSLAPVDVAVIDSGIDATHTQLAGRILTACRFEDIDGKQTAVDVPTPGNNDSFGHGTGVASIIAQLAPNARIHDLRVLGPRNTGSGDAVIAALRQSVRQGYKLINMSLASPSSTMLKLQHWCERAFYKGQVVVAAKRNLPSSNEGFPAEFSSCLGVDTARFGSPFEFFYVDGPQIELIALGEDVAVAAPNQSYTRLSGCSFAAPTITALCARLLGVYPDLTPFEVRSALRGLASSVRQAP
jgi:subtilisin family serine protease